MFQTTNQAVTSLKFESGPNQALRRLPSNLHPLHAPVAGFGVNTKKPWFSTEMYEMPRFLEFHNWDEYSQVSNMAFS